MRKRFSHAAVADDPAALKARLEQVERENTSLEERVSKGDEATQKLKQIELRDLKRSKLREAAKAATAQGITVDMEKAEDYLTDVTGEDVDALVGKALRLFGVKGKPGGAKPGVGADPLDGQGQGKANFEEIYKRDPKEAEAYLAGKKKETKFFG